MSPAFLFAMFVVLAAVFVVLVWVFAATLLSFEDSSIGGKKKKRGPL